MNIQSKITLDRLEVFTSALSKVLKPWTGWKYILPDRCGFYQNFNLGLGGSLNFQTGAGFSEKNNPHVSGTIYFRPVQGLKTRTCLEVYTSAQFKV